VTTASADWLPADAWHLERSKVERLVLKTLV
jgi:hypothetical protein